MGHLAEDCLLVEAKLFLTIAEKKRLQEDKGLKEYKVLKRRKP